MGPLQAHDGYEYRVVTVDQAVEHSTSGEWDVPQFQRRFIWNPSQVCAIADSLWRGYPIGALLLWQGAAEGEKVGRKWWIADGQHRLTALCMLYGREPAWLRRKTGEHRSQMMRRLAVRFDPGIEGAPNFQSAVPDMTAKGRISVPVARLMALDPRDPDHRDELNRLAVSLAASSNFRNPDHAEIARRLSRVSMIRQQQLAATCVGHDKQDVLEIFQRLNSRGMRFRKLLLKLAMEEIPAALRGARDR